MAFSGTLVHLPAPVVLQVPLSQAQSLIHVLGLSPLCIAHRMPSDLSTYVDALLSHPLIPVDCFQFDSNPLPWDLIPVFNVE